jgi:hypothetical protein
MDRIAETLAAPDQVRRSHRLENARLFSRWYTDEKRGKHLVVVVVSASGAAERHWIITAYLTSTLRERDMEWMRS